MSAETVVDCGECPACGKRRFTSRKKAKAMARKLSLRGVNAYPCGDYWHVGHLPKPVVQGVIDRDRIRR